MQQQQNAKCPICDSNYTADRLKCIQCQYCDTAACRKCWETYFLNELRPRCMGVTATCCGKRPFTTKYLVEHFSKSFLSGALKVRQMEILFNNEREHFTAAQQTIQLMNERTEHVTKEMELRMEMHKLINPISRAIRQHEDAIRELNERIYGNNNRGHAKYNYCNKCPVDNCKGFLDLAQFCTLCRNTICRDCNVVIVPTGDHQCSETDKQTFAAIKEGAKPCPSCGVYIVKTEGCNDMFCPECNTAFRYDTGAIQTHNSNPLYMDYVRNQALGRVEGAAAAAANQCNAPTVIDHELIRAFYTLLRKKATEAGFIWLTGDNIREYQLSVSAEELSDGYIAPTQEARQQFKKMDQEIRKIIQFILHLRAHTVHKYSFYSDQDITRMNRDIRLQYVQNGLTEIDCKRQLFKNYKRNEKYKEISQVIDFYVNSLCDIVISYYNYMMRPEVSFATIEDFKFQDQFTELTKYANDCFVSISGTYSSVILSINLYKPEKHTSFNTQTRQRSIISYEMALDPEFIDNNGQREHIRYEIEEYNKYLKNKPMASPTIVPSLPSPNSDMMEEI